MLLSSVRRAPPSEARMRRKRLFQVVTALVYIGRTHFQSMPEEVDRRDGLHQAVATIAAIGAWRNVRLARACL